jgi:general secretion pathway protein L
MADANATTVVNDGYNVATFAQFLRWWKTHLWECVPEGLRASARKNARPMMISLADDAIWPERSDLAKPLRISKTTFLSGDASKTKPVALVVGEAHGLRRKVELPLAVEERLSQVLAYELDRLTPLRADELYYDFRLLSRNVARGTCIVELIAAPKKRVNEMIALANTKGAEVTRLVLSASDIDDGVDLLRATSKDESKQDNKRWITPALLALCGVLVVALVAYPLFKKRQYVIAMMPIEASARADAEAASVVQRQLERQLTEYNHLLKRKHASPIAVQVLEDLGSGGKLLQLVQESTMLKDPVLKAAMTRVSPNAERFHFAGELVSVAPPPGLSLADSSAVLGTPMQVVPNSVGAAAATRSSSPTAAPSAVTSSTATPSPATAAPAVGKSDGTQLPSTAPAAVPQPAVPAPMKGASQLTPPTPQSTGASVDYAKKSISNPVPPQNPNPGAMQQNVAPFLQQEERK